MYLKSIFYFSTEQAYIDAGKILYTTTYLYISYCISITTKSDAEIFLLLLISILIYFSCWRSA